MNAAHTATRRGLALGAGALGLTAAACAAEPPAAPALAGRTFVLVHGAWHGGWCWRDVAALLQGHGARVVTPTLTGLGERSHLRDPAPSLATHIADVVGVIDAEELQDAILVGHSYGGMVITGVADQLKDRLRHVVYLDAALPADGQTMLSQAPGSTAETVAAAEAGLRALAPDGAWMAPPPLEVLGVPAENASATAWLARRLTPHPLQTWLDPIRLAADGAAGLARTYILCTNPVLEGASFAAHAARVRAGDAGPGWVYRELATGHDAMVLDPAGVAALLQEAAA